MDISNYICILEVDDFQINQIIEKSIMEDIKFSIFRESDMNDQITAVAIEPGSKSKKMCASFKLALKNK